jgi:hypothetical protein
MVILLTYLSAESVSDQCERGESIYSRPDIVRNHTETAGKSFQTANWKGLHDIEQPEQPESKSDVNCRKLVSAGEEPKRDHLSYDFIDHNTLGIVSVQTLDTP